MPDSQKLSHGRIVEFCLDAGPNKGQYRPAMVTRVWNDSCAQLKIHVDYFNDSGGLPHGSDPLGAGWNRSSALMGEGPGTWRWPARAA